MALIDREDGIIDYTRVARLSRELRPGYIWVSSGATEIGRLDHLSRGGKELTGENAKTDYAAQGQAILMQTYRQFIDPGYSVRQVLVEHGHFNDEKKSEHPSSTTTTPSPTRRTGAWRSRRCEKTAGTSLKASTTTRRLPASPAS